MLIAIVENNAVKELGDYRQLFPNTSFSPNGPDELFMEQNNCLPVTSWKTHDNATQKLVSVTPYIEDNQVFTVDVADKTQEELDADTASLAAKVRADRNRRLSETDWTQLTDAPVDKQVWATYRQELRDVTNQTEFPRDVQWPTRPDQVTA